MKYLLRFSLLFVFILSISSCKNTVLKKDMVLFDKAYVPVLYYVHVGDLNSAEKAMNFLKSEWKKFEDKYPTTVFNSLEWQESVLRGKAWLEEAECAIKDGNGNHALIQLDHMRYELMDLRFRKGIDYQLDFVWDFEAALDIVNETAYDPMIELIDWKDFVSLNYDMRDAWQTLKTAESDLTPFSFNKTELAELKSQEFKIDQSLDSYLNAVESADLVNVRKELDVLKMNYFDYLKNYGDFEHANSYFATLN